MITKAEVKLIQQAYLPKWPLLFISGKDVTPEQAEDIIRRNDATFVHGYFGNNRRWEEFVIKTCKIPQYEDFKDSEGKSDFHKYWTSLEEWRKKWGIVGGEYISTHWVATAYAGGPYGWVDITGRIYNSHNVGKWPSARDIYKELRTIAQTWPFLDMAATLYNNEECEATLNDAVISFQIRNGIVKVIDPKVQNIHEQYGSSFIEEQETVKDFAERIMTSMSMGFFIETAPWVTPEVVQNWSSKVFKDTLV